MLVEQMDDLESKTSQFTTAKALSVHEAEDKCRRQEVGNDILMFILIKNPTNIFL